MYTSFCELLYSATNAVWAAICCGCPPAPRPTNQRTTTPPFGPGTSVSIGAAVTSGVGSGVAAGCEAAAVVAAALGAGDADPPQAVTMSARMPSRLNALRGPERVWCIAGLLL